MKDILKKYAELKKRHEFMCENFDTIPCGNLIIIRPTSKIAIKWFAKKENHNCKKYGLDSYITESNKSYNLFNKFMEVKQC